MTRFGNRVVPIVPVTSRTHDEAFGPRLTRFAAMGSPVEQLQEVSTGMASRSGTVRVACTTRHGGVRAASVHITVSPTFLRPPTLRIAEPTAPSPEPRVGEMSCHESTLVPPVPRRPSCHRRL